MKLLLPAVTLLIQLQLFHCGVQGQAQEGNIDPDTVTSAIHNGYFSYVQDMDSADSVRQAMETLSWASVGSSWMVVEATEGAQVQATSAAAGVKVEPESTPVANTPEVAATPLSAPPSSSIASTTSSSKALAIGLGVGIPLGLLAILSVIGVVIYKKRKATKQDFEKRTANLRNMTQTEV